MSEAVDVARNGAEWLDEHIPDWYEYIDLDSLHMASCYNCIVGQLVEQRYPDQFRGTGDHLFQGGEDPWGRFTELLLGDDADDVCKLGMDITFDSAFYWEELENAWANLIKERRQQELPMEDQDSV